MWPLLHLFMCDICVSVTKPYCAIHPSITFALHRVLGVGWGGWSLSQLTVDMSPADHRPTTQRQTTLHAHNRTLGQFTVEYSLPDIWTVQTSQGKASGCPQGTENQALPPHNNVQWLFLQMLSSQTPHHWPFLQEKQCSRSRKRCWMFNVPYSQYIKGHLKCY